MEHQIYIHYGTTNFDPSKGFPIKNEPHWVKPGGGLWASRINASRGWKDWCESEDYNHTDFTKSFQFTVKEGANIAVIKTVEDLMKLPMQDGCDYNEYKVVGHYWIDFEKCLELGIDAVEICYYGDEYEDSEYWPLHYILYGWDCDSIVILNPDVVEPLEV